MLQKQDELIHVLINTRTNGIKQRKIGETGENEKNVPKK